MNGAYGGLMGGMQGKFCHAMQDSAQHGMYTRPGSSHGIMNSTNNFNSFSQYESNFAYENGIENILRTLEHLSIT